jgi:Tfp pilus assembly protein PilO
MNGLSVQRLVRRAGPTGILGVLLVLASLGLWLLLVEPESRRLTDALEQSLKLQARIRSSARQVQDLGETPEEQLSRFYGFFPGTSTVPDWLAKIEQAAVREHLVLEQGEYRVVRDRLGLITRYQIALPIRGSYPQVVNFVQRVLKDIPIAAVESLSFERQQIGDPQLDAKLRLTLFFGREQ